MTEKPNEQNSEDSQPAIRIRGLSKKYRVRREAQGISLLGGIREAFRSGQQLAALDNINLEVPKGQVLGIVGVNGSGKSTLLKIIAGISEASSGELQVNGMVGSLIEVGVGFHPELSGYDNVYLSGTILGFSRAEIDDLMAEIVEFSGLEKFMDMPVKFYSSGMYIRLGFSVAIQLRPEILLLDETFSVGDSRFQSRALRAIDNFRSRGISILLVSHDLATIRQYCDRTIWLDHGKIVMDGEPHEVVNKYIESAQQASSASRSAAEKNGDGSSDLLKKSAIDDSPLEIQHLSVLDENGKPAGRLEKPEQIVLEIAYHAHRALDNPRLSVAMLRKDDDVLVLEKDSKRDEQNFGRLEGPGIIKFSIPAKQFYQDDFLLLAAFFDPENPQTVWARASTEFHLHGRQQPTAKDRHYYILAPADKVTHQEILDP